MAIKSVLGVLKELNPNTKVGDITEKDIKIVLNKKMKDSGIDKLMR